jgi:hypothetical protein
MSKRRTSQTEDVEHLLRHAHARSTRAFFDESLEFVNRASCPRRWRTNCWRRCWRGNGAVLEISRGSRPSWALPQPDELDEEQLSQTL